MTRAAVACVAEQKGHRRILAMDSFGALFFIIHVAIIAYVSLGWLIPSRVALYCYALLLPTIAIQWVLNGGASIVNNVENLVRFRRWSDSRNESEGAFFKTLLHAAGVRASQAQITTVLCLVMMVFWVAAIYRMILIVPPPA
jgi:hypothetical protein